MAGTHMLTFQSESLGREVAMEDVHEMSIEDLARFGAELRVIYESMEASHAAIALDERYLGKPLDVAWLKRYKHKLGIVRTFRGVVFETYERQMAELKLAANQAKAERLKQAKELRVAGRQAKAERIHKERERQVAAAQAKAERLPHQTVFGHLRQVIAERYGEATLLELMGEARARARAGESKNAANRRKVLRRAGLLGSDLPSGLLVSHELVCSEAEHKALDEHTKALGDEWPAGRSQRLKMAKVFIDAYRAEHGWPDQLPRPNQQEAA
jgi:hypothetical protein